MTDEHKTNVLGILNTRYADLTMAMLATMDTETEKMLKAERDGVQKRIDELTPEETTSYDMEICPKCGNRSFEYNQRFGDRPLWNCKTPDCGNTRDTL